MLEHPVKQCPFTSDIASGFFTLNPFMAEDFIPLRQELTVQRRVREKITGIQ